MGEDQGHNGGIDLEVGAEDIGGICIAIEPRFQRNSDFHKNVGIVMEMAVCIERLSIGYEIHGATFGMEMFMEHRERTSCLLTYPGTYCTVCRSFTACDCEPGPERLHYCSNCGERIAEPPAPMKILELDI